jgi:hypothetical protein
MLSWLYAVAIVLWVIILLALKIRPDDWVEWSLILLPVILFSMGIAFAKTMSVRMEEYMNRSNLITLGLVIALPLLDWIVKYHEGDRQSFIVACGVAIILSMLTLIDVPVPDNKVYIIKHLRSILQTYAVVILIISLYKFFFDTTANSWAHVKTVFQSVS